MAPAINGSRIIWTPQCLRASFITRGTSTQNVQLNIPEEQGIGVSIVEAPQGEGTLDASIGTHTRNFFSAAPCVPLLEKSGDVC